MLGNAGLDEEPRVSGVDAAREPVDHHVQHRVGDDLAIVVVGGERVPVGDEEIALVLVLEPGPVHEHAAIVTEVEAPGGPHARKDALLVAGDGSQSRKAGRREETETSVAYDPRP